MLSFTKRHLPLERRPKLHFVLGAACIYMLVAVTAYIYDSFVQLMPSALTAGNIYWLLLGLPALGTWLTVEALHSLSPRRTFDQASPPTLALLFLGALSGVLGVGLMIGLMALEVVTGVEIGWLVPFGASALASLAVTLWLTRIRPGSCRRCGYDLRGVGLRAETPTRCPECGLGVMSEGQER